MCLFQTLYSTETDETEGVDEENENIGNQSTSTSTPIFSKKRRITEIEQAKTQMDQAVGILKSMSARSERETHEVDLYCQLLAKKIKKFEEEEREEIMHEIDDLLYKRKKQKSNICQQGTFIINCLSSEPIFCFICTTLSFF